jgi:cell wall-associated NlpC family hydrolase/uncharacterized protein YraI
MVADRYLRLFSLVVSAFVMAALIAPIGAGAQETPSTDQSVREQAQLLVEASLRVEPTHDSAEVEYLPAGLTVTLMAEPAPSPYDGALWVQAATLQSVGFLPKEVLQPGSSLPAEEEADEGPAVIGWDTIRDPNPVLCLTEPHTDAQVITELYAGQDVGLTGGPADDWQPVLCAEAQGYVPVSAFVAPPVEQTPTTEPTDVPTETPPATETPIGTETPPAEGTATPTLESTPDVAPTPDSSEMLVEVAALVTGTAIVTGTDGDGVRCRSGASSSAATITVLPEGTSVSLRGGQVGSWQPVTCAGEDGFVSAQYLGGGSQSGGSSFGRVQNTDGDGLRCRASASMGSPVITVLSPGVTVPLRGAVQGVWQPVVCANQNGWVHADFLAAASGNSNPGGSVSHGFSAGQSARVSGTNGDGVRFRSSASSSGAVHYVLSEGVLVTVRPGSTGPWVAVTHGETNGFVHMDYLTRGSGPSSPSGPGSSDLTTGSNARVTESLRLRSGASFSSGTLDIASAGIVVRITGARTNGFYPVRWDDLHGYMHGDYLTWTSSGLSDRSAGNAGSGSGSASGQAMVNYAKRYLGYPYVWGARGPRSFDCAGFVYWVAFNVTGINLVGGVINQWTYGRPVAYGDLRPGDIVYFQNTYTTGLSHIGIYIGNNQFIHASNPTSGVIISNITNSYYAPRFFGARRIV